MSIQFACPKCGRIPNENVVESAAQCLCPECGEKLSIYNPSETFTKRIRNCGCLLLVLIVLVILILPAIETARPAARRMQCTNNIKQLLLAVHNYHDTYKCLPPASSSIGLKPVGDYEEFAIDVTQEVDVSDSDEWSWRVRILPFCEGQSLYDAFNFNEPWDSEHNLSVAETVPYGLSCPSDKYPEPDVKMINGHGIPLTNYVMITGPGTVGTPDGKPLTLNDVKDGTGQTLMIVEVFGENRPAWTEPVDITLDSLMRGVNAEVGMSIGSQHQGGANIGLCDGSTHFLSEEIEIDLRRLGRINDGKIVDWD
jgi:prepilin-type processing-associated H-X9-DG protein